MAARYQGLYAPADAAAERRDLGPLPEWRLEDLYPGMDSPAFAADMARASESAKAFAAAHRGGSPNRSREAETGSPAPSANTRRCRT